MRSSAFQVDIIFKMPQSNRAYIFAEYKNLIFDNYVLLLSRRKLVREELMDTWLPYEQVKN